MTDVSWIEQTLGGARPQAVAALLRYFHDLDVAEEAFQEASLRALRNWAQNGTPRDPVGWLIMVGRNAGIDATRRVKREQPLDDASALSAEEDNESSMADAIDGADYRDDVLRLLFICCHPELPATQQIAVALRVVLGLSVPRIARAFLVSESAMEQRITRAKARIGGAGVPFQPPTVAERAERLAAVASMVYLIFNEGYSAPHGDDERASLCDEAIRLARLLLRLFQADPEMMGLTALLLLQHSRADARRAADGSVVLLEDQDRSRWNSRMINEGLALIDKAFRHGKLGPYQLQAALAAVHARAKTPAETDWRQMEALYALLEREMPSPVVTLNRAVAVGKVQGPEAALGLVEPLAERLDAYFHFHGVRGHFLKQVGRTREAREAFTRAIALAGSPAEAAHIRGLLDSLA